MKINKSEKQELIEKLNLLLQKQSQFGKEINELKHQISNFQITKRKAESNPEYSNDTTSEQRGSDEKSLQKTVPLHKIQKSKSFTGKIKKGIGSEIEKFIGENLINKIGIIVLIIGVGIGVKYAIDNNLISPLVRIILGYLVGFGLAGFAIGLKKKYLNFSAVLISGSMAIHYFITYAAYSYYNLFPQLTAIILLVFITIFTVALALYYNQQVIAHFGMVGAYIIPYLLKEPFLNATTLFLSIVIINSGILFISTKRLWKLLNYLAFIATWTIYITWYISGNNDNQLGISLTFLFLFFIIFYLVFLSYKLLLKEKFRIDDIVFLLFNSGILYFVGYIALDSVAGTKQYLGLFTLINAALHSITCYFIYKSKPGDNKLFYWTVGMVIAFLTLSFTVQFNNYYTAILWSIEAALIFLYGKSKKINLYVTFSYFLIFLTTIITTNNWYSVTYNLYSGNIENLFLPLFNLEFLSSFVVILAFAFIFYLNMKSKTNDESDIIKSNFFDIVFPLAWLFIIYFTFYTEISLYWNNIQINTSYELTNEGIWEKQFDNLNSDVSGFRSVWLLNYSMLFVSILSFVNFRWFKNKNFDGFILVVNFFMIIIFLSAGLNQLANLCESYLSTSLPSNYDVSIYHLLIRYISFAFFALILYSTFRFVISRLPVVTFKNIFEIILCISMVWISSSELIQWLQLSGSTEVYKHGLSILWGVFSLIFIVYGIWKMKKHIRISAMVLLGVTLIKLFFYDLTNLKTVPKTIVFISIGILFLIISFLYNKYKNTIYNEN